MADEILSIADDILRGARAVAMFIYGSDAEKYKRRIYHLVETNRAFPWFPEGSLICCRKSVLIRDWIESPENRHMKRG